MLIGLIFARFPSVGRFSAVRLLASFGPVFPAIVWPLLRGVRISQWRSGIGWHAGRGLLRELALGWLGYIAGIPILVLGMVITFVIIRKTGVEAMHPIINEANGTAASALRIYLLAAVWAPLAEETLFRGLLFHHLRHRHGWWISALIVSVLFAAMHPQGWAGIPVLMAIAMVLAAIRECAAPFSHPPPLMR